MFCELCSAISGRRSLTSSFFKRYSRARVLPQETAGAVLPGGNRANRHFQRSVPASVWFCLCRTDHHTLRRATKGHFLHPRAYTINRTHCAPSPHVGLCPGNVTMRDSGGALNSSQETLAIATEHGFALPEALAHLYRGWALGWTGENREGVSEMLSIARLLARR